MSALPVGKTITLRNYVRVLRAIGAPVDAGLRRARLPTHFEEIPDAWVPTERLGFFIADMAAREGVPDLGLLALSRDPRQVLVPGFFDPIVNSPTLYIALQLLPLITGRQQTRLRNWVERAGDQVRFCLVLPLPLEAPGHYIQETRTLSVMEMVVRVFAGPDFVPTRVLLRSRARDLRVDLESAYGGTPVKTGQPYGAIEFPHALLSCTNARVGAHPPSSSNPMSDLERPTTFAAALEACLEPYMLDGYPHIGFAAEIAGTSIRSLQRRLGGEKTTYMEVIDKVRCRAAMSHMRDSELTINQIAERLGYSENSSFTRAFRRWTGTTPTEYRSRHTV
jgi:AraC-like DNA-binding protein